MEILLSSSKPIPQREMASIQAAIGLQLEALTYGLDRNSTKYNASNGVRMDVSYRVTKKDFDNGKVYVIVEKFD